VSLVSESVFEAADALLVPLIPATLSSRTFDQLRELVDAAASAPQVIGFFSMVDGRKRLHKEIMAALGAEPELLSTAIPATADVERMGVARTPIAEFAPRSRAALAYDALWAELRERLAS
jgi:chromosome partitioning protein